MRASVLVAGMLGLAGVAHADSPTVGFANGARSAQGAQTVIESLRMGVANEGFRPLGTGALRSALEDPFDLDEPKTIDDAVAAVQEAKDSYASFEYGPALSHLQRADEILATLPTSERVVGVAADRYLLAGLVFSGRGAKTQAAEAFRVVQRLDPARKTLDAGTYRPAIVKQYERALAARVEMVGLTIKSDPPGAEIWVDGERVGTSPVEVELAKGLHRLAANADGHQPVTKMTAVENGDPVELVLSKPSVEKRIHALRAELAAGASDDTSWKAGARDLAALSGMEIMVVVRNAGEGVFEAAIYRKQTGELGRWLPVPSSQFYTAINPQQPERRRDSERPANDQVPAAALSGAIDTGKDDESWYSTWWGRSLIVGGAAVAVGAVVFAVTRSDDQPSVDIGDWCFGMECGL